MFLFQEIHQKAVQAAQGFKKAEANLISILQEVESSKTFIELGYTSLFQYVVQALQLSESVAANFVTVSRKAREFPALQLAITQGELTVSKARKVTAVLTTENQGEWVKKAVDLSQRRLEEEVAREAPEQAIRERVKVITEDLSELKVGISRKLEGRLKRVQDLESQRTSRAVKLSEALEALVDLYLEKKDPVIKAERVLAKNNPESNAAACVARHVGQDRSVKHRIRIGDKLQTFSRTRDSIPAQTRHQVNLRDLGQCTSVNSEGRRCETKRWLDVHHIIHRSQGGTDAIENLVTLCSSHHRMQHGMQHGLQHGIEHRMQHEMQRR